jgi:hypothetical protein
LESLKRSAVVKIGASYRENVMWPEFISHTFECSLEEEHANYLDSIYVELLERCKQNVRAAIEAFLAAEREKLEAEHRLFN